MALKFVLTQDHMWLEISKCYSECVHPMSAKLCKDISYHGVIQAVTFFGNRPNFENLWEHSKRWNIWKMADRREKRMKS